MWTDEESKSSLWHSPGTLYSQDQSSSASFPRAFIQSSELGPMSDPAHHWDERMARCPLRAVTVSALETPDNSRLKMVINMVKLQLGCHKGGCWQVFLLCLQVIGATVSF